jgi:hypothetical protein
MKLYAIYRVIDGNDVFYTIPIYKGSKEVVEIYYAKDLKTKISGDIGAWDVAIEDIDTYKHEFELSQKIKIKLIKYIFDKSFMKDYNDLEKKVK